LGGSIAVRVARPLHDEKKKSTMLLVSLVSLCFYEDCAAERGPENPKMSRRNGYTKTQRNEGEKRDAGITNLGPDRIDVEIKTERGLQENLNHQNGQGDKMGVRKRHVKDESLGGEKMEVCSAKSLQALRFRKPGNHEIGKPRAEPVGTTKTKKRETTGNPQGIKGWQEDRLGQIRRIGGWRMGNRASAQTAEGWGRAYHSVPLIPAPHHNRRCLDPSDTTWEEKNRPEKTKRRCIQRHSHQPLREKQKKKRREYRFSPLGQMTQKEGPLGKRKARRGDTRGWKVLQGC